MAVCSTGTWTKAGYDLLVSPETLGSPHSPPPAALPSRGSTHSGRSTQKSQPAGIRTVSGEARLDHGLINCWQGIVGGRPQKACFTCRDVLLRRRQAGDAFDRRKPTQEKAGNRATALVRLFGDRKRMTGEYYP